MTKQTKRSPSIPTPTPKQNDPEFSFSEDAFNLAIVHLPPGHILLVVGELDIQLANEEKVELVRKVVPKILGNGEMAAVFNLKIFDKESTQAIARILKKRTGKKYTLQAVRLLYVEALQRIRLFFEEKAKEVLKEERDERARQLHGNIQ